MISGNKRIWSLLNNILEMILGIGLVAFVTRIYDTTDSAHWFIFIAVFGILGSLRDALIQSALVKHSAGTDPQSSLPFLNANLLVMLSFEFVASLTVTLVSILFRFAITDILMWYAVYAIPNAVFRWQIFYFRGLLRIREVFSMNFTNVIVLGAGAGAMIVLDLPMKYVVPLLGTASLMGTLALSAGVPYRRILQARVLVHNLTSIRKYGLVAMLREATSAISSRIGLFYSTALLTVHQTALLGVAQRFAQIAQLPNNAFQSVLFPSLMKCVNEGDLDEARRTFERSLAQLLALTIPMALFGALAAPWGLRLVSGPTYTDAWGILSIYLFIATIITPFGTAFGSMVTVLGKPAVAFRIVLLNSVLNITIGLVLTWRIGVSGVPVALLITEIFGFIVISRIMKRMAGVSFVQVFMLIPTMYASAWRSARSTLHVRPKIIENKSL